MNASAGRAAGSSATTAAYPQRLPAGDGFEAGEEGQAGQEKSLAAYPRHLPAGGGFKEGEEGKAGEENLLPNGQTSPELLWGKEGETTAPGGTAQKARGVCWLEATAEKTTSYALGGTIKASGPKAPKAMVLVAADRPVSKWKDGSSVQIFDISSTKTADFSMEFKAESRGVHLCAIGPAEHNQVEHIQFGGCLPKALKGKRGGAVRTSDLEIPVSALQQSLLLVGSTATVPPAARGSQSPRVVQGKVQSPGVQNGGFFVMAASEPILDQEQSLANPSAYSFVGQDGSFQLTYLAGATEPLFLCAMGLPMGSEERIAAMQGQGCTRIQVPPAPGPTGAYEVVGASVTVNPEQMPLAPHEQKHLGLLRRCATAGS